MKKYTLVLLLVGIAVFYPVFYKNVKAQSTIFSKEESLWLSSRNNTIVVFPEKNFPPYSYQNSSGRPQGLSIDYLQLAAEKVGATIQYLDARPLSQILDDIKLGKGDIATSLTYTKERGDFLLFTDEYVTVPAVIVVRKDVEKSKTLTLNDFAGRQVAIGDKYAVESFVRTNYPRVIIDPVTDDEVGLQQLVLGEVDAAVMDVASLSYYLSKQVLNSVKIVGSVGFEYKLGFAVPKDKEILQSILNKGLSQISKSERDVLSEKWVSFSNDTTSNTEGSLLASLQNFLNSGLFLVLFFVGLLAIIILLAVSAFRKKQYQQYPPHIHSSVTALDELRSEVHELEVASNELTQELTSIKNLEEDIKNKINTINTPH